MVECAKSTLAVGTWVEQCGTEVEYRSHAGAKDECYRVEVAEGDTADGLPLSTAGEYGYVTERGYLELADQTLELIVMAVAHTTTVVVEACLSGRAEEREQRSCEHAKSCAQGYGMHGVDAYML